MMSWDRDLQAQGLGNLLPEQALDNLKFAFGSLTLGPKASTLRLHSKP